MCPIKTDSLITISIHAPTRERRGCRPDRSEECIISIHAPTRERLKGNTGSKKPADFNPRPHTGATAILHNLITNRLIFLRQFIQHHFFNKPVFSNLLKTVPNSPYIQVRISLRIYVYLTFALDIFTILPPLPIDNTIINIPLLALSL